MKREWYKHHGKVVTVVSQVKGKHREHCLCHKCKRFNPDSKHDNCPWANILYGVCCAEGGPMVTPVYECESFYPREEE